MRLSVMPYQAAGGAQASNGAQVSNEDQISNEDRAGICKEYLSDGTKGAASLGWRHGRTVLYKL